MTTVTVDLGSTTSLGNPDVAAMFRRMQEQPLALGAGWTWGMTWAEESDLEELLGGSVGTGTGQFDDAAMVGFLRDIYRALPALLKTERCTCVAIELFLGKLFIGTSGRQTLTTGQAVKKNSVAIGDGWEVQGGKRAMRREEAWKPGNCAECGMLDALNRAGGQLMRCAVVTFHNDKAAPHPPCGECSVWMKQGSSVGYVYGL